MIIGLDGKSYKINYAKYISKTQSNVSSLHGRARKVLSGIFPLEKILEEVQLPGTRNM